MEHTNLLRLTLLTVLVVCGGNGIGLVGAALLWKAGCGIPAAILTAAGVTLAALAAGILIVRHGLKKQKKQSAAKPDHLNREEVDEA